MFIHDTIAYRLTALDNLVFAYLQRLHSSWGIQFMSFITDLFDPACIMMYIIVLILLLWLHRKNTHLYQFLFSIGAGGLIIIFLKYGFKVPRPGHALIQETGYSFASGHAAISAIFFILIGYMYKDTIRNIYLRYLFMTLCVTMIFLVSVSRVYLGVHYFTDVLAGIAIGAIISSVSIICFNRR